MGIWRRLRIEDGEDKVELRLEVWKKEIVIKKTRNSEKKYLKKPSLLKIIF